MPYREERKHSQEEEKLVHPGRLIKSLQTATQILLLWKIWKKSVEIIEADSQRYMYVCIYLSLN